MKDHTCLLGIHVGLSPRFSRSINSSRLDVVILSSVFWLVGRGGLSGRGPSHSSAGRLSSDSRRTVDVGRLNGSGCVLLGTITGSLSLSMSSWNMGIVIGRQNHSEAAVREYWIAVGKHQPREIRGLEVGFGFLQPSSTAGS